MQTGHELSLGDILEAAFAALPAEPHPGQLEFGIAQHFTATAAEHYGLDWAEAWDQLCSVPDADLGGLKTVSGWTALASLVARNLGVTGEPLLASVH